MAAVQDEYRRARAELLELEAAKARIVSEAEALLEVLDSPGPNGAPAPGLTGPLVDREGFPRADIDVYSVRTTRHRLAILRTDRKELEAKIEAKLHELHGLIQAGGGPSGDERAAEAGKKALAPRPEESARQAVVAGGGDDLVPFAYVNSVAPGSPAEAAGLQAGDRVIRFGTIRRVAGRGTDGSQLADIGAETGASLNRGLPVVVVRDGDRVELELTPQTWSGRGTLGCHLMPI